MDAYDVPFNWLQFPQGRARFSGGVRGIVDEQRHETFAVDIDGTAYFGEIQRDFLPNNNDYNIAVVSFGYASDADVGMPMPSACRVFPAELVDAIGALIVQLIAAGATWDDRPALLTEYPTARFMGDVNFKDGWILVDDGGAGS
ncbi:hypothetical protein VC218_13330 [Xanthomonas nasturtii]|uniref:hypothetical protein n=1 Tax=Xanthomonas TaxID=338 RepID=UPI000E1F47E8|nr:MULTISPECIES: hypothetical protein [Xanthomonas]MEA9579843.1 hypothetical protein [Xanthomonas nasturtii]